MRITKQDSVIMVIKESPIFVFFISGMFLIVGLFFLITTNTSGFTNPLLKNPIAILLILIALLVAAVAQFTTIIVDKNGMQINIKRRRLIKTKNESYQVGQIKKILMRELSGFSKGDRMVAYPLFFIANDGTGTDFEIDFAYNPTKTNKGIFGDPSSKNRNIGTKVAQFIGIPFEEQRAPVMPAITDVIGAIKESITNNIEEAKKQQ